MPKPKRSRPSCGSSGRRADKSEDVAAIPAAAFCRAYEADLHRGNPPSPELLRWAGEGPDIWADRCVVEGMVLIIDTISYTC